MPSLLSELLSQLPENERKTFLQLPESDQNKLRGQILESECLPRSAEDLYCAPGTVSGPAVGRTRELRRGRVELI